LAAFLTQHRRPTHPITARGENWSAEATRSEGAAEFASFLARVHPDLLHALVEDPHATAIPPYPDFATDQLGWRLVKGSFYFHVAIGFKRFFNARRCYIAAAELVQKIVKGQFQVPEEVQHRTGRDVALPTRDVKLASIGNRTKQALVLGLRFPLTPEEFFSNDQAHK
jgi:hypothetical protein